MTRVLLVHGAFHGAWCWSRLLPELADRRLEAEAIELPFTDPSDDRQVVKDAIARMASGGDPVMVVGHSLGGAVITAAAAQASHLVYLAALMGDQGEATDIGETPGMAALRMDEEQAWIDSDQATTAFYHRCTPEDATWATAQLRSMPVATLMANMDQPAAWRTVPSTYIVCTDDQIVSPVNQRQMARNAGAVTEMDSDHSPFLSYPGELADTLAGIATRIGPTL